MESETSSEPLFIVDNSVDGRRGADYLGQWCEIARALDVATGYFEIGALLELDGKWQQLDEIRILMGDEVTDRTRRILREFTKRAEEILDRGLESDKEDNPFLAGVDAIAAALDSGQIKCRVYDDAKFHAKSYITHGRLEAVGSQALVGSSNFTRPGLTQNIELNIKLESSSEVAQLQRWYEQHWGDASDISDAVLKVVQRHNKAFTPFDVYTRALRELFEGHDEAATVWEQNTSEMFPKLDRYQHDAYRSLLDIGRRFGGAFLCDGVGLGKTYVGLMLIERLVLKENKRVVLLAPKATRESVWDEELRANLPHINTTDFASLAVFNHTDLSRSGDFPERFRRIADQADVFVIDEAHHFRNGGTTPDPDDPDRMSRYYRLFEMLDGSARPKTVYMLTATPINNSLTDFRHLIELFSRQDESYFGRTLGINNLTARFRAMTRALNEQIRVAREAEDSEVEVEDVAADIELANDILHKDDLFEELVVQRSRAYVKRSQELEGGPQTSFPERKPPKVANYSLKKTYGHLLDQLTTAFDKEHPMFRLPIYYPLDYYIGDDEEIAPFDWGRQKQVVSLIRTSFLKRFESSVYAFERSCDRLMRKLLAFVDVHSTTDSQKDRLERWKTQNADVLDFVTNRQLQLFPDDEDSEADEDLLAPELLEAVEYLDPEEFNVSEMIAETYLDLDQLVQFLAETKKFKPNNDDKLQKLIRLLKSKDLADKKVVIFTEFAETARYLKQQLADAGLDHVFELDSGTKVNRKRVLTRFAPYYNRSSTEQLRLIEDDEIRVLIATDILAEGLNLQDCCHLINYDIHWNPVRLMQRIGRIDRRLNPEIEEQILADHPEWGERGVVRYWNFLPPKELAPLLSLYQKVTGKVLVISEALGIEAGKLLRPDDDLNVLKEFNASYEGQETPIEELELELQRLLGEHPDLADRLAGQPNGVFSGRHHPEESTTGVFFCYRLPGLDTEATEDDPDYSLEAGVTRWYLYDLASETILDAPGEIASHIRSDPDTPRRIDIEPDTLKDIRAKVRKHIKNTYERDLGIPADAPSPVLRCWMELNEAS